MFPDCLNQFKFKSIWPRLKIVQQNNKPLWESHEKKLFICCEVEIKDTDLLKCNNRLILLKLTTMAILNGTRLSHLGIVVEADAVEPCSTIAEWLWCAPRINVLWNDKTRGWCRSWVRITPLINSFRGFSNLVSDLTH